jgi:hypothetical protein
MTKYISNYTKYIKIWFKRMNSTVNNVIDREEMFAGATDRPFHDKTD